MAHVRMYTRRWCGYCTAAERLLQEKGVDYEEIDTTGDHATRKWLVEATGRSTVPQIFIDGKPIGGYDDLRALDRRGELDRLLGRSASQAGAHG
jgi:GrxC family glutaredoxin